MSALDRAELDRAELDRRVRVRSRGLRGELTLPEVVDHGIHAPPGLVSPPTPRAKHGGPVEERGEPSDFRAGKEERVVADGGGADT